MAFPGDHQIRVQSTPGSGGAFVPPPAPLLTKGRSPTRPLRTPAKREASGSLCSSWTEEQDLWALASVSTCPELRAQRQGGPGAQRRARSLPAPTNPSCCCHPASIPLRFGPPFAPPSSLPPSPPCYFLCTKLVNSYFTFTCKCVNLHLHSKLENCNMILFSITSYK